MSRVLPPILYLLLDLGNGIHANFKDFIDQRIERTPTEELEARNMSFLLEIKCNDSTLAYEDSKHHAHDLVQGRIALVAAIKEKGYSKECRQMSNHRNKEMKKQIKEKQKTRDNLEKDMKNLKATWTECKGIEAKARKDNKDSSAHLIMNYIETEILKSHRIRKSFYYGSDLQGNNMQRLIACGNAVFNEVENYIVLHKPENIKAEKVNVTCTNYA